MQTSGSLSRENAESYLYRDCFQPPRPCERRDPYAAADVIVPGSSKTCFQQLLSVAMGPGVRRDDGSFVGWVERSDTHQRRCAWRWVSLRSTYPTWISP